MNIAQLIPGVQGLEHRRSLFSASWDRISRTALNEQQQNNGSAAVQQTVTNLSQPGTGVQENI